MFLASPWLEINNFQTGHFADFKQLKIDGHLADFGQVKINPTCSTLGNSQLFYQVWAKC